MSWNASLPSNSSLMRLSPGYIQNNNSGVQAVLTQTNLQSAIPYIPTSTPVYFYVNAAPTGWTIVAGVSDCLLALKGGSSAYNVAGAQIVGTWTGPSYQLTRADVNGPGGSGSYCKNIEAGGAGPSAHHHDWTSTRPTAAVGILCTKNA